MKKMVFFRSDMPNNLETKWILLLFTIIAIPILIFAFFIAMVIGAVLLPIGLILLPRMMKKTFKKQKNEKIIEVTNYESPPP
ncbi:MAG: hypothetical protein ABH873_05130 [Candidatus Firestonebacteria bacterium]